jgi:hypothetical protein
MTVVEIIYGDLPPSRPSGEGSRNGSFLAWRAYGVTGRATGRCAKPEETIRIMPRQQASGTYRRGINRESALSLHCRARQCRDCCRVVRWVPAEKELAASSDEACTGWLSPRRKVPPPLTTAAYCATGHRTFGSGVPVRGRATSVHRPERLSIVRLASGLRPRMRNRWGVGVRDARRSRRWQSGYSAGLRLGTRRFGARATRRNDWCRAVLRERDSHDGASRGDVGPEEVGGD